MSHPEPPLRHSWISGERGVARFLARPVRRFLQTEAAGGIVLLIATAVALVWANSPFHEGYARLWATELSIEIGEIGLDHDLRHWVNDALMTLFFFVVGLEIKRELVVGELSTARKATLPAVAALGGMVGPALIYAALNAGGPGSPGWGIPMATDIAFAVGVLALLGSRVPPGLKVFLLSLAIVDDIGAIAVIALFYASDLSVPWLAAAGALLLTVEGMKRVRIYWVPAYVVIGFLVWLAVYESGVHATIAGVALGLLAPARPTDPGGFGDVVEQAGRLPDEPDAEALYAIELQGKEVVSVAERLGHLLHPWTSYAIVPIFALANAGVRLTGNEIARAATSRVTLGVIAGLLVGKFVGISGAAWIAARLRLGEAPAGVGSRHIMGAAAVAGIGFTVSLFITGLAFDDPALVTAAKIGTLAASVAAGAIGAAILASTRPRRADAAD